MVRRSNEVVDSKYYWNNYGELGSGQKSIVYKACHVIDGNFLAAKVPKIVSTDLREAADRMENSELKIYQNTVLPCELEILTKIDHENIVKFIDYENVAVSTTTSEEIKRTILFFEYCSGGTVEELLHLSIYRFGLTDQILIILLRDVSNALRFLHDQKLTHEDVTLSKIFQVTDNDGKMMFKLGDLHFKSGQKMTSNCSKSIRNSIENEKFREIKDGSSQRNPQSIVRRPKSLSFENEVWPLGLLIYRCATNQELIHLTNKKPVEKSTAKSLLETKPHDTLSATQNPVNQKIEWSKTLPMNCNLSRSMRGIIEKLLVFLLEMNPNHDISYYDYFDEIDRIASLVSFHYLNWKKYAVEFVFFDREQSAKQCFSQILELTQEEKHFELQCIFDYEFYPFDESISIESFLKSLPCSTSRKKPLVIFSTANVNLKKNFCLDFSFPEFEKIENFNKIYSGSLEQKLISIVDFVKNQLEERDFALRAAQSSIMALHNSAKSKLLEILASIRQKINILKIFSQKKNDPNATNFDESTKKSNPGKSSMSKRIKRKMSIIRSTTSIDQNLWEEENDFRERTFEKDKEFHLEKQKEFYERFQQFENHLCQLRDSKFNEEIPTTVKYLSQINRCYELSLAKVDGYIRQLENFKTPKRKGRIISSLENSLIRLRKHDADVVLENFTTFVNEECSPEIHRSFELAVDLIEEYSRINSELDKVRSNFEEFSSKIPSDQEIHRINQKESKSEQISSTQRTEFLPKIFHQEQKSNKNLTTNSIEKQTETKEVFIDNRSLFKVFEIVNSSVQNLIDTFEQYPKMRAYIVDLLKRLIPEL